MGVMFCTWLVHLLKEEDFVDYICFNKYKNIINPMLAKVEALIEEGMKQNPQLLNGKMTI
jgi:hypothetical protein